MARIPTATRDNIPQDQVAEFDQMIESLGGVPPYGPGSVMIHVPKAHQAATALNQARTDLFRLIDQEHSAA